MKKHGKSIGTKKKKRKRLGVEMKKLGLIILVVVLALGALGVGYATFTGWSSTATVTQNITLGTVKVGVAAIDGTTSATGTALGGGWYTAITATVTNAYPGDLILENFQIGNIGTLPVNMVLAGIGPTGAGAAVFTSPGNTIKYVVTGSHQPGTYTSWAAFQTNMQLGPWAAGDYDTVNATLTLDPALSSSLEGLTGSSGFTVTGNEAP